MAATSVILDIRANTTRALGEFKRFSAQLDNKFLISGLKLDVVRSALGQINREFQRAIGEQGLASGQSLRAAQNQAALILDTFKNVGIESSVSITEQFSNAFSEIAITAGGTAQDIKKALGASAWISTNLAEDVRKQLAEGVLTFQRDARRAGLGDNYAEIIQQFLSGQVTARDLINSGKPLESAIGAALGRTSAAGGTIDDIVSPEQRSRIVAELQNSSQLRSTLQQLIARADWGFTIIEDLNARLFNPERGVFGVLRQVTMAVGDKTSILQETRALIDSIFGKQGLFVTFFEQVGKIFGIEDPLKVVIRGVRWITRQFNELNEFLQSPEMQAIVGILKSAFNGVKDFVTKIYESTKTNLEDPNSTINRIGTGVKNYFTSIFNTIRSGDWDPSKITESIESVGEAVRKFIRNIGESFRDLDIKKQGNFVLEIVTTLVEQVARTLGAVISEGIKTVFSGKGIAVIGGIIQVLNTAISGFLSEIFGSGAGGVLGAIATGGVVLAFGKKIAFGILAFGNRLINALPGGRALANLVRGRLSSFNASRQPASSDLGATGTFHRQVIYYLSRIANCVCGGGFGGSDIDPEIQARRNRVRSGRGPIGPGRIPGPDRGAILPGTQYRGPIGPQLDVRSSYLGAREARRNAILRRRGSVDLDRALDLYATSLEGPFSDLDFGQRREMAMRASGADITNMERVRSRYQRRYGVRGRMTRGLRGFGRGALIAGGITALGAGALGLFGGGSAQAAEFDPVTGEPIMTSGQRQAAGVGNVLSGGLEGAMTGAAIGSFIPGIGTAAGAVIGGVIGGVVPLLDEGTRKGVAEFTSGIGKSLQNAGKNISDAASRGVDWIKEGFGNIGKWFSNIDWKTVLINALVPGGNMTIQGLQGIADFASKLNIFDGIKSGIDSVKGVVEAIRDNLPSWLGGRRAVGGPVARGLPFLVGENGPELFVPSSDGSIVSNLALNQSSRFGSSSASVSANFNITINVNGGLADNNIEQLRGPIMTIINDAWKEATNGVATRGAIV